MGLKEIGFEIDASLQEQRDKWVSDIRAIDSKIPYIENEIKKAAAYGDISENNEYQSAVDLKQQLLRTKGDLEAKIRAYDARFEEYATKESSRGQTICIGSVVKVVYTELNKTAIVKVVPHKSDSPQKRAISSTSPLGRALLNKRAGDRATVNTERRKWICVIEEVY